MAATGAGDAFNGSAQSRRAVGFVQDFVLNHGGRPEEANLPPETEAGRADQVAEPESSSVAHDATSSSGRLIRSARLKTTASRAVLSSMPMPSSSWCVCW